MQAHYRVTAKLNGHWRYLRISAAGTRDWVRHISDATTWPTASEADIAARAATRALEVRRAPLHPVV